MFSYSSGKIKVALYSKFTSSCAFWIKYNSDVRYSFNSLIMYGKIRCDADVDIFKCGSDSIQSWYSDLVVWLWRNAWIPWKKSIKLLWVFTYFLMIALIPSTRCVDVIPAVKNYQKMLILEYEN